MTPLGRANQAIAVMLGYHPMQVAQSICLASGEEVNVDDLIRAVLQAIREPSEGMMEAANNDDALFLGVPEQIWRQMIDAALDEG